jgi:hypothetical protein
MTSGTLAARVHAAIGCAAVAMGAGHALAVLFRAADHDGWWWASELAIGLAVVVPGAGMASAAQRPERRRLAIAATALLFAVSFAQLLVWNAAFPLLFAALALVDAAVLAGAGARRGWWGLLVGAGVAAGALLLALVVAYAVAPPAS